MECRKHHRRRGDGVLPREPGCWPRRSENPLLPSSCRNVPPRTTFILKTRASRPPSWFVAQPAPRRCLRRLTRSRHLRVACIQDELEYELEGARETSSISVRRGSTYNLAKLCAHPDEAKQLRSRGLCNRVLQLLDSQPEDEVVAMNVSLMAYFLLRDARNAELITGAPFFFSTQFSCCACTHLALQETISRHSFRLLSLSHSRHPPRSSQPNGL